jgi:hypothetical protein
MLAGSAVATAFLLTAAPADATTTTTPHSAAVNSSVAGLLAHNPGARQLNENSVQLDEGVVVVVGVTADGHVNPLSASGRCNGANLCLFEDSKFQNSILQLSGSCRRIELSNYNTDTGHAWTNKASSIDNPNTSRGASSFYNNGNYMLTLNGGHYLKNLASDSSADGGNANDKIDSVQLC